MKALKLALFATLMVVGGYANAGLIFQAGSYAYYEDDSGLEWVYASPCAGVGGCGSDVTLIDGFRFASELDWTTSFADLSELVAAFDLNSYNSDVCASAYFGSGYSHCDPTNATDGYVWGAPVGIAGSVSLSQSVYAETFLVRGQAAVSNPIPEPATLFTLALGLLAMGLRRKA